jgi:8-oxo-dGTP diphosphatase
MGDTNQAEHERLAVSVDVVVFTIRGDALHLLLSEGVLGWQLPSAMVGVAEPLDTAARTALSAAAGGSDVWLEQLYTFGDVERVPDVRVISVAYYALVAPEVMREDLAIRARWWPIAALPQLLLDHRRIVDYALQRLRNKLSYTTVGFQLLPRSFTLSDLQRVYEVILGRALDKRNFRRKVEGLGIVKPTREQRASASGRPAQLYCFVATEAPEAIGAPQAISHTADMVQIARMTPVLRRRGRVIPLSTHEDVR